MQEWRDLDDWKGVGVLQGAVVEVGRSQVKQGLRGVMMIVDFILQATWSH